MVGLEVGQVALHDVYQEADGGAAVVGLFPDEGGQFLVEGDGFTAESAEGAEFFRVGEAWVLASMKVWAWWKPRLRS